MRNIKIKRLKHFIGRSVPYTLTISDALGKRSVKLLNGQELTLPIDDGEVMLCVSAVTATGLSESQPITVPPSIEAEYKIETGYSVYYGSIYKIKRIEY